MACIGGTVREPRLWYTRDGIPVTGRRPSGREMCLRRSDNTSVAVRIGRGWENNRSCNGCPLYRGLDAFGQVADGYTPDRQWVVSFTEAEYEAYMDGGWDALVAYKDRAVVPVSTMARQPWLPVVDLLDEEEAERVLEYRRDAVRRWRARNPGADKRNRAEYRRRKRAEMFPKGLPVPAPSESGKKKDGDVRAPARVRARPVLSGTEEATDD